jgi:hypothetical protein
MVPPIRRIVLAASQRPSPVLCGPLVVKKGSKMRCIKGGGMPSPSSSNVSTIARRVTRPPTQISPPLGIASLALRKRLRNRCDRSAEDARSGGSSGTTSRTLTLLCAACSSISNSAAALRKTAPISTVCGCITLERAKSWSRCTVAVAS